MQILLLIIISFITKTGSWKKRFEKWGHWKGKILPYHTQFFEVFWLGQWRYNSVDIVLPLSNTKLFQSLAIVLEHSITKGQFAPTIVLVKSYFYLHFEQYANHTKIIISIILKSIACKIEGCLEAIIIVLGHFLTVWPQWPSSTTT